MVALSIGRNGVQTVTTDTTYDTISLASGSTLNINGADVSTGGLGVTALSRTTINITGGGSLTTTGVTVGAASAATYNLSGGSALNFNTNLGASVLSGTQINLNEGDNSLYFGGSNIGVLSSLDINGFDAGDSIGVNGASSATYNETTGNLTFYNAANAPITTVNVGTGLEAESFTFADGSATYPCFLRGTQLLGADGPVAIEDVKVGDMLMTLRQGAARVKWVGSRMVDPATVQNPKRALPVRILRGALGENLPERDLLVSPDHALYAEGRLFPAWMLVNGTTIRREAMTEPFQYFHVEFEQHDVVYAEGVAAESYLDTGNRAALYGAACFQAGLRRSGEKALSWKDSCFPLSFGGPSLAALRAIVAERAVALGVADAVDEMALAS